ncbi:malonate decarboxylase holo-ACP synthase [Geomicrobium sp. JSM 1781026]|uniref:malonate decarboxylase holo-ACP synthase n=1 Tax=Geomicrobium sp. JSM 1781026 TaxID=3344580 RepID=UPI0035BF12DF
MYTPHDLLKINVIAFLKEHTSAPLWVQSSLQQVPFVVVRRAETTTAIPIGIRGSNRSERFATTVNPSVVIKRITPYELQSYPCQYLHLEKAKQTFIYVKKVLQEYSWGPIGSVGFEIATRTNVMNEYSDFDIIIRCKHMEVSKANDLLEQLNQALVYVDPIVETNGGWFSLREFAKGDGVLFKTSLGLELRQHPWA